MSAYSVYIVECNDGSLYTGIATDVDRRLREHESGVRGARYLRGRGPLRVVYAQMVGDRSHAQRVEYRIKQLTRQQKRSLICGDVDFVALFTAQEPLTA